MSGEPAPRMEVRLGPLRLKSPVLAASGTAGYGLDLLPYIDISRLGGIVCKSLSLEPREGNPPERILETPAGMLNSIGLQNIGVEAFLREKLPALRSHDVASSPASSASRSGSSAPWPDASTSPMASPPSS